MLPGKPISVKSTLDGESSTSVYPDSTPNVKLSRATLIGRYMRQFVPDPNLPYVLMNPPDYDHKYVRPRRRDPLTAEIVYGSISGETRRIHRGDEYLSVPVSLAVHTEADGLGMFAALDIDHGGADALCKVLDVCKSIDLWALAQISQSDTHDGGHIVIPASELVPAPLLLELTQRVALAAGVPCECFPANQDLRLPLQMHLRAPGGPRRFPILLQTGLMIEPGPDAWQALESLFIHLRPNTPFQILDALGRLPALPPKPERKQPSHRSDIRPGNVPSVIRWFNEHNDLRVLLERAGADVSTRGFRCPFHEDSQASGWIFAKGDQEVCKCFSRGSNCPLAAMPYADAFNIFCLIEGKTADQTVFDLVQREQFGQKRELRIERHQPDPAPTADRLAEHQQIVEQRRGDLLTALETGADAVGQVTVIRASQGLGKTHMAAKLALKHFADGKRVAIVANTLDTAQNEWEPRLRGVGHVCRSQVDICICHRREYLVACMANEYRLPKCTDPGCPYATQKDALLGKIPIFQHAHLHIRDGGLLMDYELVIVDESPAAALTPEYYVTPGEIGRFVRRNEDDPANPLLAALIQVAKHAPRATASLRSAALKDALQTALGDKPLQEAIDAAYTSPHAVKAPSPPEDEKLMTRQFLAGLLEALAHDQEKPNPRLAWARLNNDKGEWGFVWHERKTLLAKPQRTLYAPAVLILDGSADPLITDVLLAPWTIKRVDIEAPISPAVSIVQINCLTSTRRLVSEPERIERTAKGIAQVCVKLGVTLDGGVTYMGAAAEFEKILGGVWLHFGGQRGHNELANSRAIAIIASPTANYDVLERRALAIWSDDPNPIRCEWEKIGASGEYRATDPRLEAVNRMNTTEELKQAAYRVRPLDASEPTVLIVASPWNLSEIGLTPHRTVNQVAYPNSNAAAAALCEYEALEADGGGGGGAATTICTQRVFSNMDITIQTIPPILEMTPVVQILLRIAIALVQTTKRRPPPPSALAREFVGSMFGTRHG